MAEKRKRQSISIQIKKQIIDAYEADSSKSYNDLAKEFSKDGLSLTKSNVQSVINAKDKILNAVDNGIGAKRVRLTNAKYEDLEAAVLTWFKQVRSENVVVSGPLLKVKLSVKFLK